MKAIVGKVSSEYLGELLIGENALKKEFNLRKDKYKYETIRPQLLDEYMSEGWELSKELQRDLKVRKERKFDELLENRFWVLLYKMRFHEMNYSRNFKITLPREYVEDGEKQIDVFAKDDETVILAECKTAEKLKKKSLQKDLEEFNSIQNSLAKSIKKHYGADFKPKILWLFVTENIIWSENDKKRAEEYNIKVITEQHLPYYELIVKHLGAAAKYQFLAEFFQNQKIPELVGVKVSASKGKLGGEPFYSFITTPRHLLKIAFVNHRNLNDPDGIPTYQRVIQKTRLNKISQFIEEGGFFPTNILINFTKKVKFEPQYKDPLTGVTHGHLYLPSTFKSAWVIDGQHRLYGYSNLDEEYLDQSIFVLAFENMKHEDEAKLFVTINQEQKSVPKTIIDSLEGELKWGSEKATDRIGAISTRIVDILGSELSSPLYGRICAEGDIKTSVRCLTLPELKDGIKKSELIGSVKNNEIQFGPLSDKSDEETLKKAYKTLIAYLDMIKDVSEKNWEAGKESFVWTNIGIKGHMHLLNALFKHLSEKDGFDYSQLTIEETIQSFQKFLQPLLDYYINSSITTIESEFKGKYGSGAPKEYFFKLARIIRKEHEDFIPSGYAEWEEEQSEENIKKADEQVKQLNLDIQKAIFDKLKVLYGEQESGYWEQGIKDKNIKLAAYQKQLEDNSGKLMPKEHYLDFIQYKKVIEQKENWPHFKNMFDIKMINEDKGKAKYLSWMDKLNEIRKIYAHPTEQRTYKLEHYQFLDWICEQINERIQNQ
ncbi:DGQHR domain-containing protein [Sulfurimonas diazotrophicus]|uniref:DGQHR domain-containing protein n=1 Tax=Sulfurimonas diazotrophicus TaxID=3131939 RepID=A0ABZ3H6V7_9BACT